MLTDESRLELPERPAALAARAVAAWREPVVVDTYLPDPPDRYPAYLDRRVYQGSSGRIYPLPFHERISPTKAPHRWDAIHLENEYVRLMVMPELGGRIQVGMDRTNGYDFFYRNTVVKPALVGLAGPWLSGGVELNWPQHHRPATFLRTDAVIEEEPDGSVTVWCSDHDPFTRMKGMHGVRLTPGSSVVELRVRLFNRTDEPQSFLWWANVAAKVGDEYQSFFPTDVRTVADHAKRAVSAFPAADRPYYGVDYPTRVDAAHPDADRIDWYRNIPVPTSYMAVGSSDDFFGGYDHGARAGFVHWADHRLAPGKKQWTWGNAPFGWAWDANLSDGDGPYVELMAGVYTDNQPDFSWLTPGETRTFSQYWYPIREVGPVQQASREAAVSLAVRPAADGVGTDVSVGVAVTRSRPGLRVSLRLGDGQVAWQDERDARPGSPLLASVRLPAAVAATDVEVVVEQAGGELVRWRPRPEPAEAPAMAEAVEPPAPAAVAGVEELFLTGLHLAQYRHATRDPEPYWQEALRRDPGDSRSHLALAARRYDAADYAAAERHVRAALARLTALNPNPADGEASFRLGQVLARTGRVDAAYDAYAKAAWNRAWAVPAHLAMARLRAAAGRDAEALDDAREALAGDPRHLQVRDLTALLLRRTGRTEEADALLAQTLAADPLDWWARHLAGDPVGADAPTVLDVALEYAAAGETGAAAALLQQAAAMPTTPGQVAVAPLALYHLADLRRRGGDDEGADAALAAARDADATWCLASRLDDADMLLRTCTAQPDDARAHALLGHWLYARGRRVDAVAAWTTAAQLDDTDPVVRRNLGLAAVNIDRDLAAAASHYARARAIAPDDARLLFEADQLAKISGASAEDRLAVLEANPALVGRRDDLTVELVALLTATGLADEGLAMLLSRRFQPWEGGEGQVLAAWDEAHLALARRAVTRNPLEAVALLREALAPVGSLGEGRHLLANSSHLLLALGDALAASGARDEAEDAWRRAAAGVGDFQSMATTPFSEMTYYAVLARRRLGQDASADALLAGLEAYTRDVAAAPAVVDYFATSLPSMLLFDDDLVARRDARALVLGAQAALLRGRTEEARRLTSEALGREPWNVRALDLGRELAHAEAVTGP